MNCNNIDWGQYDVVISINIAIPTKIVQKHPNTLWAYMIGEANVAHDQVYFGYDIVLNQLITGTYNSDCGFIDFPYTFVGPECLENVMKKTLKRESQKVGIYAEVNSTKERPVKRVPQFEPIGAATGHPVIVHQQLIRRNLEAIYDSKYFLKLGGYRHTRGNGVIEAISLGTLALLSPDEIICSQVLPPEAWVFSSEEAIDKVKFLDKHPDEYNRLLAIERNLVNQFVIQYPMHYLEIALREKRKTGKPNVVRKYSLIGAAVNIIAKGVHKLI